MMEEPVHVGVGGPMTAVDAAWLRMDQPTNLMIITSVLTLDSVPDWDAVEALIDERIVRRFPRFSQRVEDLHLSRPRWVNDDLFDLALHLHRSGLPQPGDDSALQSFVSSVASRELDRRRPLWEAWLLDGHGEGAAMVFRIHHCVADGIALARVMLSLTEDEAPTTTAAVMSPSTAEPVDDPTVQAGEGEEAGHERQGLGHLLDIAWHSGHEVARVGRKVGGRVKQGVGIAQALVHDTLLPPDVDTVLRGEQSARKVVAWSAGVPLDTVRDAAHAHEATVNDVLLTALSGALGDYLRNAGTPVDEIRAMVPVNLRPLDEPLPPTLGNRFGLVFCPLPVGEKDFGLRLSAVKGAMDHIKSTPEAITSIALLVSMGISPQRVEDALIDFFASKSSVVVTNVPGPREVVTLADVPVTGVRSWAPQSGPISMSITIFSYAGAVSVGVITDPALVADPERIIAAFDSEIAQLSG